MENMMEIADATKPEKNSKRFIPNPRDSLAEGETTRDRALQKERRVCTWVYRNGISTAEIIQLVAEQKAHGYAKKLVKKGLLIETETISGSPKFFYSLSKVGLDLATSFSMEAIPYKCLSPSKLSQTLFNHDFMVQRISLQARKTHGFKYQSQAQIAIRHLAGAKIPDAVWIDRDKKRIAIEVEWSQKFGRKLDTTIDAIIESLQSGEYECYFFFVRSPAITINYSAAMAAGKPLVRWKKTPHGNWIADDENIGLIPTWLLGKIFFLQISEPFVDPRREPDLAAGL